MTTRVHQDDLVVFAAEAIVQAEWLRLQLDEHAGPATSADVPAEQAILRLSGPRADVQTVLGGRPGAGSIKHRDLRPPPGSPPRHVWATQRSPP